MTTTAGEILQKLGWNVACRGEIKVKGKGFMTTYFVDPKSVPKDPSPAHPPDTPNNNNNNHKGRKSSQDMTGERRRSSQLSLTSLKGFLSSHRGSLDISSSKEGDTHSTRSLPIYKPIRTENETSIQLEMEEFGSAGSSPRSSFDSKDSGVVKGSYRPSYPSPVAEEAEWTSGPGTPMQKDPGKLPELAAPGPRNPQSRVSSNDSSAKPKLSSTLRKNSYSSPDLSHVRLSDSIDFRNCFTMGSSRKSQRSPPDTMRSEARQAEDHLLAWSSSSPHTTITMEKDQVQSVRL